MIDTPLLQRLSAPLAPRSVRSPSLCLLTTLALVAPLSPVSAQAAGDLLGDDWLPPSLPGTGHYGGDDERVNATIPRAEAALGGRYRANIHEGAGHGARFRRAMH